MILSSRQTSRFVRLYNALIAYALNRSKRKRSATLDTEHISDDDYFAAMKYVWGPSGNEEIVRDFVRENPAGLNKTDLKEVKGWTDGFFARFDVVRVGVDTYFLVGDYGFAVRGIEREIEVVVSTMPTSVETLLLPFDGVIAFGICLNEFTDVDGAHLEAEGPKVIEHMKAGRTLARSARDYLRIVCDAAEAYEELERTRISEIVNEARDISFDDIGYDSGDYDEMYYEAPVVHKIKVSARLEKGMPTTSLAEVLAAHTFIDLERLLYAQKAEPEFVSDDTTLDELVEKVLAEYHPTPRDIFCQALIKGSWHVIDLKRMVDAGGAIRRPSKDTSRIKDIPEPFFPFIQVWEVGDDYLALMPDEIKEILADADWEEAEDLVDEQEVAFSELESEIDFRGLVAEEEAMDYLVSILPYEVGLADRIDLTVTVQWCLREDVESVATDDYVLYFTTRQMAELLEPIEGVATDRAPLDSILAAREGIEPRHVDDMPEFATVADYVFEGPAWKALSSYLSHHGIEDHPFSLVHAELANDIVYATRYCDDVEETVRDTIEEYGGDISGGEADRLIKELVRQLPLWTLNGWAPRDLER